MINSEISLSPSQIDTIDDCLRPTSSSFVCVSQLKEEEKSDKDLTHDIHCYLLFSSFFFDVGPINIPLGMCANKNNYTLSQSHLLHQFMYIPTQLLFYTIFVFFLPILRCNALPLIKIIILFYFLFYIILFNTIYCLKTIPTNKKMCGLLLYVVIKLDINDQWLIFVLLGLDF